MSDHKSVTMSVVLGSGKPASVTAPADMDEDDLMYLIQAVLDFRRQVRQFQNGQRKPIHLARSI